MKPLSRQRCETVSTIIMNVDNVENSKNDEKNVQTTATDQHAHRRKQQVKGHRRFLGGGGKRAIPPNLVPISSARGHLVPLECKKTFYGRGAAPHPAGGSLQCPQTPCWWEGAMTAPSRRTPPCFRSYSPCHTPRWVWMGYLSPFLRP